MKLKNEWLLTSYSWAYLRSIPSVRNYVFRFRSFNFRPNSDPWLLVVLLFISYTASLFLLLQSLIAYKIAEVTSFTLFGEITIPDWFARSNVSDSVINLFSFYWTSLTYLPALFTALILTYFISYERLSPCLVLYVIGGTFAVYLLELGDLTFMNSSVQYPYQILQGVNLLLLNNLNKYHPFIFYVSVGILLFLMWPRLVSINLLKFGTLSVTKRANRAAAQGIWFITTALILGSWWAFQEGTWGGWWNWDPSEVFGWLLFLILTWLFHNLSSPHVLEVIFEIWLSLTGLFLAFYFFLQLNFDLTSHSFGARFSSFFNNSLFFLEMFSILVLILLVKSSSLARQLSNLLALLTSASRSLLPSTSSYLYVTLLGVSCLLIMYSLLGLVNYFLWRYVTFMSFNSTFSAELLIQLSYVYITSIGLVSLPPLFWVSLMLKLAGLLPSIAMGPLLIQHSLRWPWLFHYILLILVYLNVCLNEWSSIVFTLHSSFQTLGSESFVLSQNGTSFSCDGWGVENGFRNQGLNSTYSLSLNLLYTTNSDSLLGVLQYFSSTAFYSVLTLGHGLLGVNLVMFVPSFSCFTNILLSLLIYTFISPLITKLPPTRSNFFI